MFKLGTRVGRTERTSFRRAMAVDPLEEDEGLKAPEFMREDTESSSWDGPDVDRSVFFAAKHVYFIFIFVFLWFSFFF